jgi:hypothetical protein
VAGDSCVFDGSATGGTEGVTCQLACVCVLLAALACVCVLLGGTSRLACVCAAKGGAYMCAAGGTNPKSV